MAKILKCEETTEWIEEEVSRPVEEWVENTEEVCKNWPWPLNWVCKVVTTLVKIVTWVVEIVGKWVTRTVCKLVDAIIGLVVDIAVGLYDIVVGIFTWDWARVWDGFERIIVGTVGFVFTIIRIVFFGDTIAFIREEVNKARLKNYVKDLLEKKYKGEELEKIKDALGINHGAFGLRIAVRSLRTYVKSNYKSNPANPPDLILWHEDPALRINLKELCGFDYSEFWRRFRPEVVGESGGFSEADLDEYISSRGESGKVFSVFCMDKSTLETKHDTASNKARALSLMFRWTIEDVEVRQPEYVRHNGFDTNTASASLINFVVDIAGRHRQSSDQNAARADLCVIPAAGIFWYTDNLNGLTVNYRDHDSSGLTFKDRKPDFVWKYVLIHEIGHYFGLPHVSGLDRIMYSGAAEDETWLSWWLLPEYIYLEGGPSFIFDEAKKVWDYIIEYFPADCLASRAE